MKYTLISREEAPTRPPLRKKRRVPGADALVGELVAGKVARIELADDEKPRVVVEQLYRTAAGQGKGLEVWEVGGILYAEVVGN